MVKETGPPCPGVVLLIRCEERLTTVGAEECPAVPRLDPVQWGRERRLRPRFAGDVENIRGQDPLPVRGR